MKVVCINNKNRPNEVLKSKWDLLIEGDVYTVIETMKCNVQGGLIGFKLAEIDLSDCQPYTYFAAHRFALPKNTPIQNEEKIDQKILIL